MDVPFVDLDAAYRELEQPIDDAVKRVLGSSRFILGMEVEHFERAFADHVGARHCVGVGNGLDALTLALASLDIGSGDEVIVPAATAFPTWLAVSRAGATPVAVGVNDSDVYSRPWGSSKLQSTIGHVPSSRFTCTAIRQTSTPSTRLRDQHGLLVVDDAAQAHGARYRGRPIGALTSASAFSFYPTKNLGAVGDGGAVTTDDDSIADRVRMLRNYGARGKYRYESLGWNSRLDPIQAAILRVKLDKLDEWNARRRRVATRYREGLSGISWLRLPSEASWAVHVYHLFVVRARARDELAQHLSRRSVTTAIHYPVPPYRQPVYHDLPTPQPVGELDAAHGQLLSLPIGPHLSDAQVDHVIDAVSSFGVETRSRAPRLPPSSTRPSA